MGKVGYAGEVCEEIRFGVRGIWVGGEAGMGGFGRG